MHLADNSAEGEKSSMSFKWVTICTREFYEEWKLKINTAMTKTVAFMKGGKLSRYHGIEVTNNYNTHVILDVFHIFHALNNYWSKSNKMHLQNAFIVSKMYWL